MLYRILTDGYKLTKFECRTSLNNKKLPTLNTYELHSILRRLKTNAITEESEPTLKDVPNSLSQINGLLTNLVVQLVVQLVQLVVQLFSSTVENHLNDAEQRLTNLEILENKVKDLEDSQDFLSKKYEIQSKKIEGI